jgi:hypothetical protein
LLDLRWRTLESFEIPPKVIRKKTCLLVRGLFKLSKDFEYKRHLNIERGDFFFLNYKNEKKKCVS